MRIPLNSSSTSSTKPTNFSSFNLVDNSPMSIPSPNVTDNQQFRRPPQSEQEELKKLSKVSASNPPPRRSRIITSDDESSPNVKPMGMLAATTHTTTSSDWMKARDPASISNNQRNRNIVTAQVQRKAMKSGVLTTPKYKSTQIQNTLTLVDDDDDDTDTSADEAEQGGTLSGDITRMMSSLPKDRSITIKADREARLMDRQNAYEQKQKEVVKNGDSKRGGKDDESGSEGGNESEDGSDGDVQLVESRWEDSVLSKAAIKSEARSIILKCENLSGLLRSALRKWAQPESSANNSSGSGNSTIDNQDCINLISINRGAASTATGVSSILSDEDITTFCSPDLVLKPYQLVGVNWLKLLHETKINGVLADDMGLGKTVQSIAFLGWLKQTARARRPHLIVVPASTLSNWEIELARFCPSLRVTSYQGSFSERHSLQYQIRRDVENRRLDIVLGTYTMFERESSKDDRNFLRKLNFEYLILDEGHCIKNTTSSRYYNLMGLNVQRRLLLSGTPVQNNVGELLGVLSFLMPKMFTAQDCEMLIQAFDTSQTATITQLRGILAPFVLRRLKRDVLNQLVEKETTVLKVEMTPSQTSIYYDIIFAYKQRRERIMKKASDEQRAMDMVDGGARKKKKIQELLLQQKQASSTVTDPTVSDSADGVVDLTSPSGQDQPTIGVSAETAENKVKTEVAAVNLVMECDTVTGDGSSGRTDSAFSSSASLSGSASNTALVDMSVAESTTVTTTTTPAVDLDIDGEVVDEVVASAVRELSATEAKHLFTALRKAANHPLLLRIRYSNEDDIERIARVALSNGYFGNQCDLARVKSEIVDYSDFDLHQICTMYPQYLSQYELPIEALFDSPKMVKLQEMIPKLLAEGHRILLFSQWTRILDLLEVLMNHMGLRFLRLDGSTPVKERQQLIDTFNQVSREDTPKKSQGAGTSDNDEEEDADDNEDGDDEGSDFEFVGSSGINKSSSSSRSNDTTPIPVFLLSTKAGGLGINLTSADTVILHDLDFNPENDRQAEDRCHRIGQTRPVHVYKLVADNTVDSDIYEMGERKRQLSSAVLSDHRTTDSEKKKPTGKGAGGKRKGAQADDDDDDGDVGAIGRILQKALQRANAMSK